MKAKADEDQQIAAELALDKDGKESSKLKAEGNPGFDTPEAPGENPIDQNGQVLPRGEDSKQLAVGLAKQAGAESVTRRVSHGDYWLEGGDGSKEDKNLGEKISTRNVPLTSPLVAVGVPSAESMERRVSYGEYWVDGNRGDKNAAKKEPNNNENSPCPSSPLRPTRSSRPGAHREGGQPLQLQLSGDESSLSSAEVDTESTGDDLENTADLAVANIVNDDDDCRQDLPQAQSVDHCGETPRRRSNRVKMAFVLPAILGLVVVAVFVVVFLGLGTKNENDDTPTQTPTPSPTSAPTMVENYALSLFPDYTIDAIQQDLESPQARAFEWLLEDIDINPSMDASRMHQRFCLATLYFATQGEQWMESENWLDHSANECNWYSILDKALFQQSNPTCDATGNIQHLGLEKNNLVGSLPMELFLLTHLKTLALGLNRLQGPIPGHVGRLTALQGLWINSLQNGGEVPTQVGLLTNLIAISFVHNEHVGSLPSQLGLLTNMRSLMLGRNPQLRGILPDISRFPNLLTISVDRNRHTGTIPTEVGLLSNLMWFLVGGNRLHGPLPTQLGLLPNIQMASFYRNQLEGSLPTELGLMSALTLLALKENKFAGTIPSQYGRLTNLTLSLGFQGNPMLTGSIPTELGLLSNLYELSFRNNNHTGVIPSQLGMLKSISGLSLGNNSLTGKIPSSLAPLHQSLYHLDVDGNPLLSGTFPEELCTINGTCIPHPYRMPCSKGTHLAFDCTDLLCGCDCVCGNATA